MNICTISYHSCPFSAIGGDGNGGMSVYVRELSAALARDGARIDVFTRRQRTDIDDVTLPAPGIRVIHLPAGPARPLNRASLPEFLSEFQNRMLGFMTGEKRNYHLMHSHYWMSGRVGAEIRSRLKIPLVHTYHTLGFLRRKVLADGADEIRVQGERKLADRADRIIASSRIEKQALEDEYDGLSPHKIRIVNPGVDSDLFLPTFSEERNPGAGSHARLQLIFAGRIDPMKGLLVLVRALDHLRRESPGLFRRIGLTVVGGGRGMIEYSSNPEFAAVSGEISRLGLENRIKCVGSLPQTELAGLYADSDALVVPSLYESFGLVVVEALACGTPVLVSDVGPMPEIIREGETGISFPPGDPAALAEGIRRFDRERERFSLPADIRRTVVPSYSWSRTARETLRIFREIRTEKNFFTTRPEPGGNPPPV